MSVETDQAAALELARGLDATASNIERVAGKTSPPAARWAFTQWELRAKAVKKGFPRAEEMLFHEVALEQATHFSIARYHASLFPPEALVADLTTGVGSDLIALAERGPVIGFDIDPNRLEYARHNLGVLGLEAELVLADSLTADWKFDFAYVDPSRRVGMDMHGYRIDRLGFFSPNPIELARRLSSLQFSLMKMTPMFPDEILHALGKRVDFVSYGRECREALIYSSGAIIPYTSTDQAHGVFTAHRFEVDMFGSATQLGQQNAIHVESGESLAQSAPPPSTEDPLPFLYEADPAAIRCHGLGALGAMHNLFGLGDSNGYLTCDHSVSSVWLTGYRVRAFGHFDKKSAKAQLLKLGGGTPIVKSRTNRVDVNRVRKDLTTKGRGTPVIAIYPVGKSLRFVIVERI